MNLVQKNTRKQGDVGLGKAIAYFTGMGYSVSLPLTESQRYDMIVDDGEECYRVEVKTSRYRKNENSSYVVLLSTQGGNRSWNGNVRPFSAQDADYVFAAAENGECYLFPSELLDGKRTLSLTKKVEKYRV